MNNNELDNTRQDGSENLYEQKAGAGQDIGPGAPKGQQKLYSVGGNGMKDNDNLFTPPYYVGKSEYSYQAEDKAGSRLDFTEPPKKRRRGRGSRVWLIALAVVAIMIMSALAGLGGMLIVDEYFIKDRDDQQTTAAIGGNTEDTQNTPTNDSPMVIIKNNDSRQIETVTGSVGDENLNWPDVVELVKDSVVEIYTEKSSYVGRLVESGAGSGVIIGVTEDQKTVTIVTNNHVISGADTITVKLTNGSEYKAELCGADATTDIALLTITTDEVVTRAALGSSASLMVGEDVIAIGNPLGKLGGTVTKGIISALAREVEIDGISMTLLQTDAAVNPGNSGGGLFNKRGELIGIVNAKSTGDNLDDLGYAIPIDKVYEIVQELYKHGYVTGRVEAGLKLEEGYYFVANGPFFSRVYGVFVVESKYTDEIKPGDRIVSVNSIEVSTIDEIKGIISKYSVGDTITIRVSREGKQSDVNLTLREYIPEEVKNKFN